MIKSFTLPVVWLLVCIGLMFATMDARAITYTLADHPDGVLTDSAGPYGLRLDGLAPPDGVGPTFSTELNGASAQLEWDGITASMSGSLWNNTLAELWEFTQTFTGVTAVGDGFTAVGGVLSIWDAADFVPMHVVDLKQDVFGKAFYFLDDSDRCDGHLDCGPFVGRGWVDGENGTNDWLVQASEDPGTDRVPEPAVPALLGIGLLALRHRMRASQAKA